MSFSGEMSTLTVRQIDMSDAERGEWTFMHSDWATNSAIPNNGAQLSSLIHFHLKSKKVYFAKLYQNCWKEKSALFVVIRVIIIIITFIIRCYNRARWGIKLQ